MFGYDTKTADSEGLALGTAVLPWTFTALLITDLQRKTSSGTYPAIPCKQQSLRSILCTTAAVYIELIMQNCLALTAILLDCRLQPASMPQRAHFLSTCPAVAHQPSMLHLHQQACSQHVPTFLAAAISACCGLACLPDSCHHTDLHRQCC